MSVAPGWYDDGVTPAVQRWYDGAAWTEHTRALPPSRRSAPSAVPRVAPSTTTGATTGATAGASAGAFATSASTTGAFASSTAATTRATTAWPVTPHTRESVARGAAVVGPAGEKYPQGWGEPGYEIGPARSLSRVRPRAEAASDWPAPTTGRASDTELWRSPVPWPVPAQPRVPDSPGSTPSDPMHWLLPVGRSWQSIVAGYLGLIGLLIWPLAPLAVWLGFWGRNLARVGGNGGGRSNFAIVSGLVGTFVGVFVLMAVLRG